MLHTAQKIFFLKTPLAVNNHIQRKRSLEETFMKGHFSLKD